MPSTVTKGEVTLVDTRKIDLSHIAKREQGSTALANIACILPIRCNLIFAFVQQLELTHAASVDNALAL